MNDGEECIHGLWPLAMCSICNGHEARRQRETAEQPRIFTARFEGQCRKCNLPILIGQTVAWLPDHPTTHEECWT